MNKILTILCIIVLTVGVLLAHTSGIVKKKCPLCAHKFKAEIDMSGTQFGIRLDLKPLGPTAAPWRLAVCPKCHFVLFKEDLSENEKQSLNAYIKSEEYKRLLSDGHTSYFLLAKIFTQLNHPSLDIAHAYLQASWQVESGNPNRYQAYLKESLQNFRDALKDEGITDVDERNTASLLVGEILRQLSQFDKGREHFEQLAGESEFKKQPYRTIVQYELELIAAGDAAPKERPPIVLTHEDKMELPGYQMCYGLAGIGIVTKNFTISSAHIGSTSGMPCSLNVFLDPNANNTRLVNSAWWNNPVNKETQEAEYNWLEFMECYQEIDKVASKHKWLSAWRAAGTNRTVQARIFGMRPYKETMLEYLVVPGWKHAGMKGTPAYEIKLLQAGELCGTIFFGKDDPRGFVKTMYSHGGKHWLDKQSFSYHPTQEIPEYIIVDTEGNWFKNNKKRQDSNKAIDK